MNGNNMIVSFLLGLDTDLLFWSQISFKVIHAFMITTWFRSVRPPPSTGQQPSQEERSRVGMTSASSPLAAGVAVLVILNSHPSTQLSGETDLTVWQLYCAFVTSNYSEFCSEMFHRVVYG